MLMTDAILHHAAGALEQPRPFEQLVFRCHRARTDDFFSEEKVRNNGDWLLGHDVILTRGPASLVPRRDRPHVVGEVTGPQPAAMVGDQSGGSHPGIR